MPAGTLPVGLEEGGLPEPPQMHLLTGREGHTLEVPYFLPLLFDEDKLQEALHFSKSNTDMALHEATIRA
ncbi:hypothetical protein E2C01_053281 [Portunus trituberculatus]|uniref:Uncharacterized protein n=1 Tax=Portunus trituberculatus TaxID=210409 RepID=A0A5B7GP25_PORTR|nr:hypothetical protein [Portunus trituberculatus]